MKDVFVLRDLEQIKAIAHPYRIEILECFHENNSATAKQIADKMGEPHAKINYHIKALQKVGILTLVDERVKSGIVEKYYLPSAKTFIVDKHFHNPWGKEISRLLSEFQELTNQFYDTVENSEGKKSSKPVIQYHSGYLTKDEMKELKDRLQQVINEYMMDKMDHTREKADPYTIGSFIIPKVDTDK